MSFLIPRASSSFRSIPTLIPTIRSISSTSQLLNEQKIKVPISLIANLRKEFPVPLSQAREALEKSNLDLKSALEYLKTSTSSSENAEKKAAKISGRITNEGIISISLLGNKRVSMIHLGCETDFVARNKVFLKTAKDISDTTAFLDVPNQLELEESKFNNNIDPILEFPTESLLSAPLISLPSENETNPTSQTTTEPQTIKQTLLSSLSQTGENLKLLRSISFATPFPSKPEIRFIPSGYSHGGNNDKQGKIGGIIVLSVESLSSEKPITSLIHGVGGDNLENELNDFARIIARQVVGFPTKIIENEKFDKPFESDEILYEQPFMMFNGDSRSVKDVLKQWGEERGIKLKVVGMRRWSVGDELDTTPAGEGADI